MKIGARRPLDYCFKSEIRFPIPGYRISIADNKIIVNTTRITIFHGSVFKSRSAMNLRILNILPPLKKLKMEESKKKE